MRAALVSLLLWGVALAAPAPDGMGNPAGLTVADEGTTACREVTKLDLQSPLAAAKIAGACAIQTRMATDRLIGRLTAGTGEMEELTGAQATGLLSLFSTSTTAKGVVPGSNGATAASYLNATGGWTIPEGRYTKDITTVASCNGTDDNSGVIQTLVDDLSAAGGGTIRVPAGKVCGLASTITWKTGVSLVCEGTATGFKALTGITNSLLRNTSTSVADWSIRGCYFDLNSKAGINAVHITSAVRYFVQQNYIWAFGAGASSAYSLLRLDCSGPPCVIQGNTIVGTLTAAANDTGIEVTGGNPAFVGNNNVTWAGAGGIVAGAIASEVSGNNVAAFQTNGIAVTAAQQIVAGNNIAGSTAAGIGVKIGASGSAVADVAVSSNVIVSNPVDSLGYGVQVWGLNNAVLANVFSRLLTASVSLQTGWGIRVMDNRSVLGGAGGTAGGVTTKYITPTFKPVHVEHGGAQFAVSQVTIMGNVFVAGWRGVDGNGTANTLTNLNIANNRFYGVSGACVAMGGAGVQTIGNYCNGSPTIYGGAGPATVCNPTCSTNKGSACTNDADCGTCSSTYKCGPEPTVWIGAPQTNQGTAHAMSLGNIWYLGMQAGGQCTGASTNAGQICTTGTPPGSSNTCADSAACSGTPAVCQAGGEQGRRCCTGTPTCSVREPWSGIRFTPTAHAETSIAANAIFGGQETQTTGISVDTPGITGDPDLSGAVFTGNNIYFSATADSTTTGIKFPTGGSPTMTKLGIHSNHFWQVGTKVVGWDGTWGNLAFESRNVGLRSDFTTSSATFVDVGSPVLRSALDANAMYYFNCEATFSSSDANNGIAFAVTGPASPTHFTYLTRLPKASVEAGGGTDTMSEQQGNADDETSDVTPSVGAAGATYVAAVRGNVLVGATAGNLTLRVKSENGGTNVTVYKGTNCRIEEMPL